MLTIAEFDTSDVSDFKGLKVKWVRDTSSGRRIKKCMCPSAPVDTMTFDRRTELEV